MPDEAQSRECTAAFVLAGGQSRRMGRDKALLSFAGEPLIARALRIFRDMGLDASIAGTRSPLHAFAPVVEDALPDLGPLAGVCSALRSTKARWCIFLPVDLPLMPAALLTCLLRSAQITGSSVTLPAVCGFPQTFPVVLDRGLLPALNAELAARRLGCFSTFKPAAGLHHSMAVLPVELLVQGGQVSHPAGLPALRWFMNINTPADLHLAEMHCRHLIA